MFMWLTGIGVSADKVAFANMSGTVNPLYLTFYQRYDGVNNTPSIETIVPGAMTRVRVLNSTNSKHSADDSDIP